MIPSLSCTSYNSQVVEDGYEFFARRQLVTLFSAPNYCGDYDNAGGMMTVDEDLLCSFQVSGVPGVVFCAPGKARWNILGLVGWCNRGGVGWCTPREWGGIPQGVGWCSPGEWGGVPQGSGVVYPRGVVVSFCPYLSYLCPPWSRKGWGFRWHFTCTL